MPVLNETDYEVQIGGPFNNMIVTEKSGGDFSRETAEYADPNKDVMQQSLGRGKYSNLTLRVPYDPDIHDDVSKKIQQYCGEDVSVVVQAMTICPEKKPVGKPYTYIGCKPIRFKTADYKKGGGANVSMYELEFTVNGLVIG